MKTRTQGRASRIGATGAAMAAALLAACDSGQVPTDATLTLSPQERSIRITEYRDADGVCRTDGSRFVDVPMLLRLTSANGSPIGDADVEVYVDFSGNTYSGRPVLALFEDRNGNGIVDADTELASGAGDSIARVRTGDDGSYRLLLRADIACPYRGEVFAYVGGTHAQASFEVEAAETVEPEPVQPETPAPRLPDQEPGTEVDGTQDTGTPTDPDTDPAAPGDAEDPDPLEGDDTTPFDTLSEDDLEREGGADDPAPQPVHCIEPTGRRTAVVCTVDPEAGS